MTGHGSIDTAIEAIKLGAMDYLSKPFDFERLEQLLTSVHGDIERRRALLAAESRIVKQLEFSGMVGRSAVMLDLFDRIRRFAPHVRPRSSPARRAPAKSWWRARFTKPARARARNSSPSTARPWWSRCSRASCSGTCAARSRARWTTSRACSRRRRRHAVPRRGRRASRGGAGQAAPRDRNGRGAAGGRPRQPPRGRARGGGDQSRSPHGIGGRPLRGDLFYRLSVVELHVPPLRERREDIPYLTASFVRHFAGQFRKAILGPTPAAERLLLTAPWPGNVRELRNVIERICILSEDRFFSEKETLAALNPPHGSLAAEAMRQSEGKTGARSASAGGRRAAPHHARAQRHRRQQEGGGADARPQPPRALPEARSARTSLTQEFKLRFRFGFQLRLPVHPASGFP